MLFRLAALALVIAPVAALAHGEVAPKPVTGAAVVTTPLTIDTPIEAIAADPRASLSSRPTFPA